MLLRNLQRLRKLEKAIENGRRGLVRSAANVQVSFEADTPSTSDPIQPIKIPKRIKVLAMQFFLFGCSQNITDRSAEKCVVETIFTILARSNGIAGGFSFDSQYAGGHFWGSVQIHRRPLFDTHFNGLQKELRLSQRSGKESC